MKPTECPHEQFTAKVAVGRILDIGKFVADVTVNCIDCGVAMRFVGVPAGLSYDGPRVSIDGETLHAPIEPAYEKTLAASARYEVPEIPQRH